MTKKDKEDKEDKKPNPNPKKDSDGGNPEDRTVVGSPTTVNDKDLKGSGKSGDDDLEKGEEREELEDEKEPKKEHTHMAKWKKVRLAEGLLIGLAVISIALPIYRFLYPMNSNWVDWCLIVYYDQPTDFCIQIIGIKIDCAGINSGSTLRFITWCLGMYAIGCCTLLTFTLIFKSPTKKAPLKDRACNKACASTSFWTVGVLYSFFIGGLIFYITLLFIYICADRKLQWLLVNRYDDTQYQPSTIYLKGGFGMILVAWFIFSVIYFREAVRFFSLISVSLFTK